MWAEGTASAPVEHCGTITLTRATTWEAAHFARWLRDDFVPSPSLLRFTSEPALERALDTEWPVPPIGDAEDIEAVLREHLHPVD